MKLKPFKSPTVYLPGSTLRPHCVACGNYLLPCTATANGIHEVIAGAGHLAPKGDK